MSAAATWKTTNAPIQVKNKTSARPRNTNLINGSPSDIVSPGPVFRALLRLVSAYVETSASLR